MQIYADNAATTRLSDTALKAMLPYLQEEYGNPSSLHSPGQRAQEALTEARSRIAQRLGCQPTEVIFTSGGSEADNQAIRSAAAFGKLKGKTHIISTAFEHHAVLHTLEALEKEGFTVTLLDVHEDGMVSAQQVEEAITDETCLVTIMYANNEIGTVQPIAEIGEVCRRHGVLFHTDAVQAVGHIPVDVDRAVLLIEADDNRDGNVLELVRSGFGNNSRDFVTAVDENSVIRIYNRRRELIAVHEKATHKWQRVSNPDHEPKNIAKFMGTTPDALIFRASKIGENLVGWVKTTLDSSTTRSDMFRTVDSVLRFAATADKDDMEEAAQKAVKLRVVTVKGFKSLYNNIHDGKSHVSDNGDGSLPLFNFKPIYLDENADGEVKR